MGYKEITNNRNELYNLMPVEILIYLLLFLTTVISDYFFLILNIRYKVSLILGFVFVLFYKIKVHCKCRKINRYDLFAVIFIIGLTILRIAIPDNSYDTLNYHLLFQESIDHNCVNFDFFPGRAINQLYLCLGDRVFSIFRLFFGYRCGTILNSIVLIILWFQTRNIFEMYVRKNNKQVGNLVLAILILFAFFSEQIIWLLSTYYVDLLALPFLVEILRRCLCEEKQNLNDTIIVGVMSGMALAIKPYNALWLVPLAICYLYTFGKKLKIKNYFSVIVGVLLPNVPYLKLSYENTGNPFFPYLNSIFKSPYWYIDMSVDEFSGIGALFGPENWKEYLLWPYYMTFENNQIYFSDINRYNGKLLVAVVIVLIIIIVYLCNRICEDYINKIVFTFVLSYIFYLTLGNGHLRYALFLEYVSGVIIAVFVICLLNNKQITSRLLLIASKVCGICLVGYMSFYCGFITNSYMYETTEYSWRTNLVLNREEWLNNAAYLLNDYGSEKIDIENLGAFLVFDVNASMMKQIQGDIPIINIADGVHTDEGKQQLQKLMDEIEGEFYTVARIGGEQKLKERIGMMGFEIIKEMYVDMPVTIGTNKSVYLVQIRINESFYENQYYLRRG